MTYLTSIVRSAGDPQILDTGPSSFGASDQLARALGWLSIGLGLTELFAPRYLTRALGLEGREGLVRAYGLREIAAGMLTLSPDKRVGLQSRVAGDALDLATLIAIGSGSSKRSNLMLGVMTVLGVTLLDAAAAMWVSENANGAQGAPPDYSGRSGYPKGLEQTRGAAPSGAE